MTSVRDTNPICGSKFFVTIDSVHHISWVFVLLKYCTIPVKPLAPVFVVVDCVNMALIELDSFNLKKPATVDSILAAPGWSLRETIPPTLLWLPKFWENRPTKKLVAGPPS